MRKIMEEIIKEIITLESEAAAIAKTIADGTATLRAQQTEKTKRANELRAQIIKEMQINGIVKEIPALTYTKATKHFTLKNIDKRISTLKSLAPKKVHGTIKNKGVSNTNDKGNNSDIEEDA